MGYGKGILGKIVDEMKITDIEQNIEINSLKNKRERDFSALIKLEKRVTELENKLDKFIEEIEHSYPGQTKLL